MGDDRVAASRRGAATQLAGNQARSNRRFVRGRGAGAVNADNVRSVQANWQRLGLPRRPTAAEVRRNRVGGQSIFGNERVTRREVTRRQRAFRGSAGNRQLADIGRSQRGAAAAFRAGAAGAGRSRPGTSLRRAQRRASNRRVARSQRRGG